MIKGMHQTVWNGQSGAFVIWFEQNQAVKISRCPCFLRKEPRLIMDSSKVLRCDQIWGFTCQSLCNCHLMDQGIVGCTPTNVPLWEIHGNPYISPISTMGTLLGVHPIVPFSWSVHHDFQYLPVKKPPALCHDGHGGATPAMFMTFCWCFLTFGWYFMMLVAPITRGCPCLSNIYQLEFCGNVGWFAEVQTCCGFGKAARMLWYSKLRACRFFWRFLFGLEDL